MVLNMSLTECEWYWRIPRGTRPVFPIADAQIEGNGDHWNIEDDLGNGSCCVCVHGDCGDCGDGDDCGKE